MEKKMETTGVMGIKQGLYWDYIPNPLCLNQDLD